MEIILYAHTENVAISLLFCLPKLFTIIQCFQ